jgi:hypothetical protein
MTGLGWVGGIFESDGNGKLGLVGGWFASAGARSGGWMDGGRLVLGEREIPRVALGVDVGHRSCLLDVDGTGLCPAFGWGS